MGCFPNEQTASCYRIGHVTEDLQIAMDQGKDLIVGHIDFSHLEQLSIPGDYQLLAMFRQPVDRIISTYLHFQRDHNPDYSTWKAGKVEFQEFLKSDFAQNWTCQLLSGWKGLSGKDWQDPALLNAAMDNFNKLSWVGISESFDDSLFSLSRYLGRSLKYPGRYNEGAEADEHQRLKKLFGSQIRSVNALDMKLYSMAESRLKQQLSDINMLFLRKYWYRLTSRLKG